MTKHKYKEGDWIEFNRPEYGQCKSRILTPTMINNQPAYLVRPKSNYEWIDLLESDIIEDDK